MIAPRAISASIPVIKTVAKVWACQYQLFAGPAPAHRVIDPCGGMDASRVDRDAATDPSG
jgi:hypothetical protein